MFSYFNYVKCVKCGREYGYDPISYPEGKACTSKVCNPSTPTRFHYKDRTFVNAQLSAKDRPIVWEHPVTGEIRYPGRNDGEMPQYYKDQGYQKREITSYQEHQKFNKEHGLVNHAAEGIRDEALH